MDITYASKMCVITAAYPHSFAFFSNIQKILWDDVVRNRVASLKSSITACPRDEIEKTWASKKGSPILSSDFIFYHSRYLGV